MSSQQKAPKPTGGAAQQRNLRTIVAGVKLAVFTAVAVIVTSVLAMVMGHFGTGNQTSYQAVFSSASELKPGDDVRVAGVSVGEVQSVQIHDRDAALVTFKVDSSLPVTTASGAQIRFLNLVGDRYLALTQGSPGAPRLQADGTIPEKQTTPALNLTELFNGFQPLFQALKPADVNALALNLVRVLQGEGGTVQQVLAHTASLTSTLANRNQLIGQVIDNLTGTLKTVDNRHRQLTNLLTGMRTWFGHLSKDRQAIGDSIGNLSSLTAQVAGLLSQSRPNLKQDIVELRRVMAILNRPANQKVMSETLQRLPTELRRQARIGTFGSWYNYYLCDFTGHVIMPKLGTLLNLKEPAATQLNDLMLKFQKQINNNMSLYSTAPRCHV